MANRIVRQEQARRSRWLTTGDVAQVLGVTARWVRWLARQGELACERTEGGVRIFDRGEVRRVLIERTEAHARSRPAQLAAIRLRMVKAGYEPRQLSLFSRTRLQLVRSSEGSDPQAEVKVARSFTNARGSEKGDSVNRKVGTR
jgi:excisionase family DNA binding protein